MGAGDRYQQPKFTVPMPPAARTWPFPDRQTPCYCMLCGAPLYFCGCDPKPTKSQQRRLAVQKGR